MRHHHVDSTSLQRLRPNDVDISAFHHVVLSALLGIDIGNNEAYQLIKNMLADRNGKTYFEIGVPIANPCTNFDV